MPSCQKGRGLQLRAWLIVGGASARLLGLKVCVCGPRSRPSAGRLPWHWRWCGDCGLVARSGRRVLRRLSPVASLWGWVRVRCNPMACPGAAWVGLPRVRWWRLGGWGLVGRVTGPSSRAAGNCETCTPGQHAAQADTASFRAVPCVGGKEAISRSDTALSWQVASASNLRNPLQMRMPSMHVSATVVCCHVAEQIAGNPFIEVRKMVSLCNSWKKPFLRRTQGLVRRRTDGRQADS